MLTQGLCILDLAESHVLQLPPFATSNPAIFLNKPVFIFAGALRLYLMLRPGEEKAKKWSTSASFALWGQQRVNQTHKICFQLSHFLLVASHSVAVHSSTLGWNFSDFQIHLFKLKWGEKKVNHMHILYSPKWLALKGLDSKSWVCSWGSRTMALADHDQVTLEML